MDKKEISDRARVMVSVDDLAELLDEIRQDEFGSYMSEVTGKQLKYFSNSKIPHRYQTFHIKKKSGGLREINAPCKELKKLLRLINILLKSIYEPDNVVTGFVDGRSVVDNAKVHVDHHYVFNIDLKDFFPSIPGGRVRTILTLPPFNFPEEIANVIANLCCHETADKTKKVLPQGAATSPILTNAVCQKLDKKMKGVAKRFGLHYTRYADDMTFSSMHNVYQDGSEFRTEIESIIKEQGFTLNEDKTRLLRDGRRQEVTGLTVNSIVNVSRKYVSDLRWILHVWETEGYAKAYIKFYPKYKHDKGYIKKGEPILENVIRGKLNYLKMVKGENNVAYKKLSERFNKLNQVVYVNNDTKNKDSYVYVQPYTMAEFLKYFSTQITLEVSSNNNLRGKCMLAGKEKYISISKDTQSKLCPNLATRQPGDIIESSLLQNCHVTLCRSKRNNFWLITKFKPKRSPKLGIPDAQSYIKKLFSIWEKEGLEKVVEEFKEFHHEGAVAPIDNSDIIEPHEKREITTNEAFDFPPLDLPPLDLPPLDLPSEEDIKQFLSMKLDNIDIQTLPILNTPQSPQEQIQQNTSNISAPQNSNESNFNPNITMQEPITPKGLGDISIADKTPNEDLFDLFENVSIDDATEVIPTQYDENGNPILSVDNTKTITNNTPKKEDENPRNKK